MKKKDSNPSSDKTPDEEIEFRVFRDPHGILPRREWSCLVLDVSDVLAPRIGTKGMELYYWIAQLQEMISTEYEGQSMRNMITYTNGDWVGWSKGQAAEVGGMIRKLQP